MNLFQFFFKEELALKVYVWERKIKDISVKTLTSAHPLADHDDEEDKDDDEEDDDDHGEIYGDNHEETFDDDH